MTSIYCRRCYRLLYLKDNEEVLTNERIVLNSLGQSFCTKCYEEVKKENGGVAEMTFDEFIASEKHCNGESGSPLYTARQMRAAYDAGFAHGHDRTMEKFGVKHFDVWYYPKKGELPKSEEMTRVLVYDGGTFYLGWYIPNNRKWLYAGYTTRMPEAWQYLPDFPIW